MLGCDEIKMACDKIKIKLTTEAESLVNPGITTTMGVASSLDGEVPPPETLTSADRGMIEGISST